MQTFIDKLKGARRSFTVWFNSVVAVIIGIMPMLQDALPMLAQYVPNIKWVAVALIVGNVILRFKTNVPLEIK